MAVRLLNDLVSRQCISRTARQVAEPRRATTFNLTVQELRLLNSFRGIPDDERRDRVLEALELFHIAYA